MLTERYGKRPEDIMPFGQASLADIIHDAIGEANDGRVAAGIRPVFPRWLHSELVGPAGPEREAARELWSTLDSLLVIDSLSIFSPEAIADKAVTVLSDPAAHRELGRTAERMIQERYSLEAVIPEMMKLYTDAAAHRSRLPTWPVPPPSPMPPAALAWPPTCA